MGSAGEDFQELSEEEATNLLLVIVMLMIAIRKDIGQPKDPRTREGEGQESGESSRTLGCRPIWEFIYIIFSVFH